MFSIFNKAQIVEPLIAKNLHLSFAWALDNFDRSFFNNTTVLVLPTREFFPDRADNELDMARALCSRILKYAGIADWPFKLVLPHEFSPQMPPVLNLETRQRQDNEIQEQHATTIIGSSNQQGAEEATALSPVLEISYISAMMKKPMDLVGSMSKNIAQHYLFQAQITPPAGPESFDASAEILAIFMGFGIMIANSAYTFRGSCARCYDPRANRTAALSEDEAVYCLALFCHYKKIDSKEVTPSLKNYLRASFKKARKQIARNSLP
ncbi:hypothetical protein SAMN02745866_02115 [Alteromonadaceae bacterium Bs31]|nr:hypothetical protein SAMN02745866_02115 [Alteromonadaceae bacterium Bs31]